MQSQHSVKTATCHTRRQAGPARAGWYRITLRPEGLARAALVVIAYRELQHGEIIATVSVGPEHAVTRAVYFRRGATALEIRVYATAGASVQFEFAPTSFCQLATGIFARLRHLRHAGIAAIAHRSADAARRLWDGRSVVGGLPLQSIDFANWLERYVPCEDDATALFSTLPYIATDRFAVLLDDRGAADAAIERSLAAIVAQSVVPDRLVRSGDSSDVLHEIENAVRGRSVLFWMEAGEVPH